MQIAFIVGVFPALSETFILNQITGLVDRGHDVDIYADQLGDTTIEHADVARYRLLDVLRCRPHVPQSRCCRVLRAVPLACSGLLARPGAVVRSFNIARWGRYAGSLRLLYDLAPFLRHRAYDIIQCHYACMGVRAVRLRALHALEGKVVTMFHGADIRWALDNGPEAYRDLIESGDCFLSISAYNRLHLLQFGFDDRRIVDHPVGVDIRRFPVGRPKEGEGTHPRSREVRILTVARLVREKALHFGIEAVREVLRGRPTQRVSYGIVGEGYCRPELEEMIKKYSLTDTVTLLGARDESQVREELLRSDIFLLPSISEALPVVLMEAQASGLPVVASAVGSVDSIIREGISGYLVRPGDVQAVANRLSLLIKDPEQRCTMGRAGRAHVEAHYDVNKLNDRLIEIYDGLLNAGRSRCQ